ncbi:hypothetical protein MMPV_009103 [Pyropia vietnamensis]
MVFVEAAPRAYGCRLGHAPWDGLGPADLVMPLFLFCVGMAQAGRLRSGGHPPATTRVTTPTAAITGGYGRLDRAAVAAVDAGDSCGMDGGGDGDGSDGFYPLSSASPPLPPPPSLAAAARRAAALAVAGIVLGGGVNAPPSGGAVTFAVDASSVRLPGVLQRIAAAQLACAAVVWVAGEGAAIAPNTVDGGAGGCAAAVASPLVAEPGRGASAATHCWPPPSPSSPAPYSTAATTATTTTSPTTIPTPIILPSPSQTIDFDRTVASAGRTAVATALVLLAAHTVTLAAGATCGGRLPPSTPDAVAGLLSPGCNGAAAVDAAVLGTDHLYGNPPYGRLPACSAASPCWHSALPAGEAGGEEAAPRFRLGAPAWCGRRSDPEGPVSSLAAIAAALVGLAYGCLGGGGGATGAADGGLPPRRAAAASLAVAAAAAAGHASGWAPVIKALYTPAYAAATTAAAIALHAALTAAATWTVGAARGGESALGGRWWFHASGAPPTSKPSGVGVTSHYSPHQSLTPTRTATATAPTTTAAATATATAIQATAAALRVTAAMGRAALPLYVLFGLRLAPAAAAAVYIGGTPSHNAIAAVQAAAAAVLGADAGELAVAVATVGVAAAVGCWWSPPRR